MYVTPTCAQNARFTLGQGPCIINTSWQIVSQVTKFRFCWLDVGSHKWPDSTPNIDYLLVSVIHWPAFPGDMFFFLTSHVVEVFSCLYFWPHLGEKLSNLKPCNSLGERKGILMMATVIVKRVRPWTIHLMDGFCTHREVSWTLNTSVYQLL